MQGEKDGAVCVCEPIFLSLENGELESVFREERRGDEKKKKEERGGGGEARKVETKGKRARRKKRKEEGLNKAENQRDEEKER